MPKLKQGPKLRYVTKTDARDQNGNPDPKLHMYEYNKDRVTDAVFHYTYGFDQVYQYYSSLSHKAGDCY